VYLPKLARAKPLLFNASVNLGSIAKALSKYGIACVDLPELARARPLLANAYVLLGSIAKV